MLYLFIHILPVKGDGVLRIQETELYSSSAKQAIAM